MKLSKREKRMVEICDDKKSSIYVKYDTIRRESDFYSDEGAVMDLIRIIGKLSNPPRKSRVKVVKGWAYHSPAAGWMFDTSRADKNDPRATLTIQLPKK